ncbi:MAG: DNA polymerase I [Patescibacteria group bacterium]
MAIREKFVIFDGNALVHRAFHALPPLTTKDGTLINAAYGFTTILLRVLKELKPKYVAVTFDLKGPTFRHQEFKEYKAQRVKQPQELYDQIPIIKELVKTFNLPIYTIEGYEADDVIGTVTKQLSKEHPELENIIVTGDLDTLQLVDDHTKVYTLKHGMTDTITYESKTVKDRYGLLPEQMIDYKALRGDPSDNIPGVPGIGEKTAAELIQQFGNLDNLYQELKKNSTKAQKIKPKVKNLLTQHYKEAQLSKKLVTIVRDIKLPFKLTDCIFGDFDTNKLIELFQKLEFKSLLQKIPQLQTSLSLPVTPPKRQTQGKHHYQLIANDQSLVGLIKKLKQEIFVVIDSETSSLDPWQAELIGISLAFKVGEAYFIPKKILSSSSTSALDFKKLLTDNKLTKGGHNIKYDLEALWHNGLNLNPITFDTMIAAYLLRAGNERTLDLNSLAFQEFGYRMQPIEELIGPKGKGQINMQQVPIEKVSWYSGEDADYTLRLKEKLEKYLTKAKLDKLFHEIEMPLVPVLGRMEQVGVKIDEKFLQAMGKRLTKELNIISVKIIKLSGTDFNIASPKQLKEVLFDRLKISPQGIRKIKTGFSTAASELEKMRGEHPIIDLIIDHRELSKLLSTYIEALPELINKATGRVHTSFNQTVTATGRLSSSDPNLQNIPIKGDLGKELRRAFIAEPGYVLLSADYSQIELRLAAHIADDKKMKNIFQKGEDFHCATAAFVFSVKPEDVTSDQRRQAKEVNFGVLYGMGVWGLAERTGISREEARFFIDKYFSEFAQLADWIENIKEQVKKTGEVFTLLGRRRKILEINSGVQQIRAQAERMAVNLPIQGTAADLMKLAMIKVAAKLPEVSQSSKMILQVHDELVFEVPEDDIHKVAKFVKEQMEQALKLSVPIVVDVKQGKNWGEMEVLSS